MYTKDIFHLRRNNNQGYGTREPTWNRSTNKIYQKSQLHETHKQLYDAR